MASTCPASLSIKARVQVCPLDVECFECEVKPSEWCIVPGNGRRADGYHRARRHLASTGDEEAARIVAKAGNKFTAKLRELAEQRKQARGAA